MTQDGRIEELPNESFVPTSSYKVKGADVLRALEELDTSVFAVWHTHPRGQIGPSPLDMKHRVPGLTYVVVSLHGNGEATASMY